MCLELNHLFPTFPNNCSQEAGCATPVPNSQAWPMAAKNHSQTFIEERSLHHVIIKVSQLLIIYAYTYAYIPPSLKHLYLKGQVLLEASTRLMKPRKMLAFPIHVQN